MNYTGALQTRTFKLVEKNRLSDDDLQWIRSLGHVSVVTVQRKTIRVLTETDDAIAGIITSINTRYCNSSNPKLSPLF
jgi:uncharacterized protein (UPF0179 family)